MLGCTKRIQSALWTWDRLDYAAFCMQLKVLFQSVASARQQCGCGAGSNKKAIIHTAEEAFKYSCAAEKKGSRRSGRSSRQPTFVLGCVRSLANIVDAAPSVGVSRCKFSFPCLNRAGEPFRSARPQIPCTHPKNI